MSDHASSRYASRRWGEIAYTWIGEYAKTNRKFIGEECTQAARAAGVALPDDPRAWGSVFRRAAQDGIIRRIGYEKSPLRHRAPTILWESTLYCGPQRRSDAPDQTDHSAPVP